MLVFDFLRVADSSSAFLSSPFFRPAQFLAWMGLFQILSASVIRILLSFNKCGHDCFVPSLFGFSVRREPPPLSLSRRLFTRVRNAEPEHFFARLVYCPSCYLAGSSPHLADSSPQEETSKGSKIFHDVADGTYRLPLQLGPKESSAIRAL